MLSRFFPRLRQNIIFSITYFGVLFACWFFAIPNSSTVENECLETPKLTFFGLGEDISEMRTASRDADSLWSSRQDLVVSAFQHAWKGYSQYAFGNDEYYPLEKKGENFLKKGIGFTIVDSLDTMILMGLEEEYTTARQWVENELTFDQSENVNVFETTIRVLGGLLSSYFLTGSNDTMLLQKATDLAQRLSIGFETKSGIPIPTINLGTGKHSYESVSSTAEAATLQLENKYLSHLLGDPHLWQLSQKVNDIIDELPKLDGLVPIYMSSAYGTFTGSEIRLGSRGDSYYEYLLKQWLQTNKKQVEFLRRYDETVYGIRKWLLGASYPMNLTFIGEIDLYNPSALSPKMDHLVCFMAGNLALGATEGLPLRHQNGTFAMDLSPWDQENLSLAESLAEACWYTYTMNPTGLAAEISVFNTLKTKTKDAFVKPADTHNLLRPETIESLFILWRITKDPKYREWGWEMFLSFEQHTKVEHGYVALSDATVIPPVQRGKMETFFLAETLKYFYLLFSADDFLHLDKVVFNTEAHPLPRFTPRRSFLIRHSPPQESIGSLVWQKFLKVLANITMEKSPPNEDSIKMDVSTSTSLDDFDQDEYSDHKTEEVKQENNLIHGEDDDSRVDGLNSHILKAFRSIHDTVTTTAQPTETDLP